MIPAGVMLGTCPVQGHARVWVGRDLRRSQASPELWELLAKCGLLVVEKDPKGAMGLD